MGERDAQGPWILRHSVSRVEHRSVYAEIDEWRREAGAFGSLIGTKFKYDSNEIAVTFGTGAACQTVPACGFCLLPPPYTRFECYRR